MSKSKKNKKIQVFLSPENFIRKKSRNLPIIKCLINIDWEKAGLANIIIAREHTNGNLTFCMYLVDTKCLGVKDTLFQFNVSSNVFDNCIDQMDDNHDMEEISYKFAHNIIFAAIEFAEEYGFVPHKDFTSITQYFLEEDNDDIPLIDIHCGNKNGIPLYVYNGYESSLQAKKIINQLDKTAGQGNYEVILNTKMVDGDTINDDDDEYDDYDYDDDEDAYDIYYQKIVNMDKKAAEEEAIAVFKEYQNKTVDTFYLDSDIDFVDKVRILADFWREEDNMLNTDVVDKYLEMMKSDFALFEATANDEVPNSLFPSFKTDGKELYLDLLTAFIEIQDFKSVSDAQQQIKLFKKQHGDCAVISYLNLMLIGKINGNEHEYSRINKELERFPNYFLIEMLKKDKELRDLPPEAREEAREQLRKMVEGKTITKFEMSQFIRCYASILLDYMNKEAEHKLEKTQALLEMIDNDVIYYADFIIIMFKLDLTATLMNTTIDEFFKRR
ncbi:MAG: hypothetical protein LBD59_07120 [Prevotellaceae bacterium]|jgi:hypothetical protein|nr:hypothetical protein [Prevotellaceae bacterium]